VTPTTTVKQSTQKRIKIQFTNWSFDKKLGDAAVTPPTTTVKQSTQKN